MSSDDDVADRILEGTPYEQAEVTVSRTFPLGIRSKIRVAVATLGLSALLAPGLFLSRDRIRSFAGVEPLSAVFGLRIVGLGLGGAVVTFATGLLLVRQLSVVRRRSLSESEARRLVRIEDVLMFFLLQGSAFVLIAVTVAVVGVVPVDTVDVLYEYGLKVYQPARVVRLDARFVSALGVGLAVLLYALYRRVR